MLKFKLILNVLFVVTPVLVLSRMCSINEYGIGSWFLDATVKEKSFLCCGYDEKDYLNLRTYCGYKQQFSFNNMYRGGLVSEYSVKLYAHLADHACRCDFDDRTLVKRREQYRWRPFGCEFPSWNATDFCLYLGKRNIMIIGDSVSMQQCDTLINMIIHADQNCADQIYCARSNHLISLNSELYNSDLHNFTYYLQSSVLPDIVLISTGAHFQNMTNLFNMTIHLVVAEINELKHNLLRKNQTMPIFYWNQISIGHINCHLETEPLQNITFLNVQSGDQYHWKYLEKFDELARELFLANNLSYFDMTPLKYRADGHISSGEGMWNLNSYKYGKDCLHYCAPGPLDIFSQALQLHLSHLFPKSIELKKNTYSYLPVGTPLNNMSKLELFSRLHDVVVHCFSGSRDFYYVQHGILHKIPNMDTFHYNNFSMGEVMYFDQSLIEAAPKGDDIPACIPGPRCRRR